MVGLTAEVKEKEEARATYDDAVASGHTAALGEEKSGDVFNVRPREPPAEGIIYGTAETGGRALNQCRGRGLIFVPQPRCI